VATVVAWMDGRSSAPSQRVKVARMGSYLLKLNALLEILNLIAHAKMKLISP